MAKNLKLIDQMNTLGLSQTDLSRAANVTYKTVNNWVNGKTRTPVIVMAHYDLIIKTHKMITELSERVKNG